MSQKKDLFLIGSLVAAADLDADVVKTTSQRYRAVKLTAARAVNVITGVGDVVIGVQQNLPKTGESVEVVALGSTKLRAAAAVTVNTRVKIDSAGKFIDGGGGADRNWALSLEAAAADGDIFEAYLTGLIVT